MKQILQILIPAFIYYGCCSPPIEKDKFEFTDEELGFLKPLAINDTIYFESNELDIDTILIRKLNKGSYNECSNFIQRAPSNWRDVEIKHLPVDKWTGTSQNQNEPPKTTYQSLFSMSKDFKRNSIDFSISFRGFHSKEVKLGLDSTSTVILNSIKIQKCYQLDHYYPERISEEDDVVRVYWSKVIGLVGYENKSGEVWINKAHNTVYSK